MFGGHLSKMQVVQEDHIKQPVAQGERAEIVS